MKRKQATLLTSYTGIVSLEHKNVDPTSAPNVYEQLKQSRLLQAQQRESSALYCRFDTLREAIEYNGTEHQHRMPIFAHNHPSSNTNYYVVASYDAVWRAMTGARGLRNAHFYEQLRPIDPCHGFVDVEIYREPNTHRTKNELESEIHIRAMSEMRELARQLHYINQDSDMTFVVSESSNSIKVSLHFHVLIRHARFKNLYHFGSFMRFFVRHVQQKYGTDVRTNPFFFRTADGSHEFWADMAVYTLNRNFRMLYNTKTSEYRPLLPVDVSQTNRSAPQLPQSADELDKSLWLCSILQRISAAEIELGTGFRLLTCVDPITNEEPTSTSNKTYFRLDHSSNSSSSTTSNAPRPHQTNSSFNINTTRVAQPRIIDTTNVPPVLIALAGSIAQYWSGKSGTTSVSCAITLHQWKVEFGIATYSSRSKYCALAGRAHQSNHVRFQMNVRTMQLSQTCFDAAPTCAGKHYSIVLSDVVSADMLSQLMPFAHNVMQVVAAAGEVRREAIELIALLDV